MNSEHKGCVAVVEDEQSMRETVRFMLEREGYQVDEYADGLQAWTSFQKRLPDLVVLDILLPRMDGLELCRRVRSLSETLPIIFLTSKDEEIDRVLGLELGADDYLCKPFSLRELAARVRVLFRPLRSLRDATSSESGKRFEAGRLLLDFDRYEAVWDAQLLPLTVTEFRLLSALARYPGHVKTREQLMQAAYPDDTYVSDRTIDSHIKRLRKKFTDLDPEFAGIETVYGLGYRYRPQERV